MDPQRRSKILKTYLTIIKKSQPIAISELSKKVKNFPNETSMVVQILSELGYVKLRNVGNAKMIQLEEKVK